MVVVENVGGRFDKRSRILIGIGTLLSGLSDREHQVYPLSLSLSVSDFGESRRHHHTSRLEWKKEVGAEETSLEHSLTRPLSIVEQDEKPGLISAVMVQ